MAEAVIMPRQGQSVESCLITAINKKQGDAVNTGDILFSYETDKSAFDEEAKFSGTVLALLFEEGDEVPCLESVMIIGEAGEDISGLLAGKSAALPPSTSLTPPSEREAVGRDALGAPQTIFNAVPHNIGELKISPRARIYAEQAKVDLSKVIPTGPNGRVIERDVIEAVKNGHRIYAASDNDAYVGRDALGAPETPGTDHISGRENPAPTGDYTDVKLSNIRKIIAKAMHESLSRSAQLTLNSSFDAGAILNFRKNLKDFLSNPRHAGVVVPYENITINDIILYTVSKTLRNHKDANAHYLEDPGVIRYFNAVNLGIAVDTPRGLVVPVIFNADKFSLNELAKESKKIISEAQSGAVAPDKLKGGTFTVTNLGALGIESFTPVINPPQTCILGVNNITRRIKQVNGQDIFYDCMALSLTFDHRALDGAPAARFLQELCVNLENFDLLLAK